MQFSLHEFDWLYVGEIVPSLRLKTGSFRISRQEPSEKCLPKRHLRTRQNRKRTCRMRFQRRPTSLSFHLLTAPLVAILRLPRTLLASLREVLEFASFGKLAPSDAS